MIGRIALFSVLLLVACEAPAHDPESGRATAIRNEGVMVEVGETKILFDPIYDNNFGDYHEIPETLASAITSGTAPYDQVDAVFVTHAHGDHFSASGLNAMMAAHPSLLLYAPAQAIEMMREDDGWMKSHAARVRSLDHAFGTMAAFELGPLDIQALSIPHAGWPENQRDLQHYVYRLSFEGGARVMHLGDATHEPSQYTPYRGELAAGRTGMAFVPYWMLLDPEAREVIEDHLNADHIVGIHVPTQVPEALRESGKDYFSVLGETRDLPAPHDH